MIRTCGSGHEIAAHHSEIQRQRYVASWALPSWVDETSSAFLPEDRQCACAAAPAVALSVSSAYQRRVIASGVRLIVQGGPPHAASASRAATATARRANASIARCRLASAN